MEDVEREPPKPTGAMNSRAYDHFGVSRNELTVCVHLKRNHEPGEERLACILVYCHPPTMKPWAEKTHRSTQSRGLGIMHTE